MPCLIDSSMYYIFTFICVFLTTVYNYWLVVMCYEYMFHVDIVKMFDSDSIRKRKYLISTIFAWGVPLIVVLICRLSFFFVELGGGDNEQFLFKKLVFIDWCIDISCNYLFAFHYKLDNFYQTCVFFVFM